MTNLPIGLNGRFSPRNGRTALEEIAFCHANGFAALQFRAPEGGLTHRHLGAQFEEVAAALTETGITAVIEMPIFIGSNGLTMTERGPLDVLHANLPVIQALNCTAVHWRLAPNWPLSDKKCRALEQALIPQLAEAARLGDEYGFQFGIAHNEARLRLCGTPDACHHLLNYVPGLRFVWHANRTDSTDFDGYAQLSSWLGLLHLSISETANTEIWRPFLHTAVAAGFAGAVILDVSGLPKTDDHGRGNDDQLNHTRDQLQTMLNEISAEI